MWRGRVRPPFPPPINSEIYSSSGSKGNSTKAHRSQCSPSNQFNQKTPLALKFEIYKSRHYIKVQVSNLGELDCSPGNDRPKADGRVPAARAPTSLFPLLLLFSRQPRDPVGSSPTALKSSRSLSSLSVPIAAMRCCWGFIFGHF